MPGSWQRGEGWGRMPAFPIDQPEGREHDVTETARCIVGEAQA